MDSSNGPRARLMADTLMIPSGAETAISTSFGPLVSCQKQPAMCTFGRSTQLLSGREEGNRHCLIYLTTAARRSGCGWDLCLECLA